MKRTLPLLAAIIAVLVLSTGVFAGVPQEQYVQGRLLVRFNQDIQFEASESGVVSADPQINRLLDRFGVQSYKWWYAPMKFKIPEIIELTKNDYIFEFPKTTDMELVAKEFNGVASVSEAMPDRLIPFDASRCLPNDDRVDAQWWIHKIQGPEAWCYETGSADVLVCGVDSGIDWNHPDIVGNIWVNREEDPTGNPEDYQSITLNNILNPGANDNVDDDDNGLVDDFIGWDFVTGAGSVAAGEDANVQDQNPMDFNGHGTGVNSSMAAVANNEIGVASIAYGCKIIAVRAGYDTPDHHGLIMTSAAQAAIFYATEKGVKVINMSYGGSQFSSTINNNMQAVWNQGVLLFGAAGNENVSSNHYPSAYLNVISVAATDRNDMKAGFSNYGYTVNIASPGVSCLTGWYDDMYDSWDGTSVASPIAAGVGALVVSVLPDATNQEVRDIIEETTDSFPAEETHMIGTGRINAFRAITEHTWPMFDIDSVELSNPDGNAHPDPGETIEVRVHASTIATHLDAENAVLSLSFDVEGLNITNNHVALGNVAAGSTIDNDDSPISFEVPADFERQFVNMTVTISSDPNDYELTEDIRLMVGEPDILIVDDDDGYEFEKFIEQDMDELETDYFFATYDVNKVGAAPTAAILSEAKQSVLWLTGDAEDPLSEDEQSAIQSFVNGGKALFIFGQNIDEQLSGTDFYANVLHAESTEGNIPTNFQALGPVADNALGLPEGFNMVLAGDGGASNCDDPDAIAPVNGASALLKYLGSTDDAVGAVYYHSGDKTVVYCSAPFEAVSGMNGTKTRVEFLNVLLAHFETDVEFENDVEVPTDFAIQSAYPNPFNPSTNLKISVPQNAQVQLVVYDILGREVATLVNERMAAGVHTINWNAAGLSNGVYFAVMQAENVRQVVKLAYVK